MALHTPSENQSANCDPAQQLKIYWRVAYQLNVSAMASKACQPVRSSAVHDLIDTL